MKYEISEIVTDRIIFEINRGQKQFYQ